MVMLNSSLKESLVELNRKEAEQYLGGVIFVTVVMVVGIIGNMHVLFVYTFRIQRSNHRIFILVLGVLDFITCTVGMPFIIFDLRNPLTFTVSSVCKLLRFTNYFTCTSSSLILVLIAIDRYRKICVPHGRQITLAVAKLLCFVILLLDLLMSWPAPILYGIAEVQTSDPNITGSRCYTENEENYPKYQLFFNFWLIFILGTSFCVLVVLYTLICRVIMRRSRMKYGQNGTSSVNISIIELPLGRNDSEINILPERNEQTITEAENIVSCGNNIQKTRKGLRDPLYRRKKTTAMFFLLTSVFFISYFPHLCLKVVTFMNKDFLSNLTFEEKVVYNTFIWCFFINSMANCFIYGCFDARFRRELNRLYNRLFCRG